MSSTNRFATYNGHDESIIARLNKLSESFTDHDLVEEMNRHFDDGELGGFATYLEERLEASKEEQKKNVSGYYAIMPNGNLQQFRHLENSDFEILFEDGWKPFNPDKVYIIQVEEINNL